jgi:hypothetical protein
VEVSVNQSGEAVEVRSAGARLSSWKRLAVAAPGALAAALLVVGGAYYAVTGFRDAAAFGDDDLASIPATSAFVGVAACVFGLVLAAVTVVVTLPRPHRALLTLAAVVAAAAAAWWAIAVLAAGAEGLAFVPLMVVLVYLAAAAVLRLLSSRRATNA